MRRLPDLIAIGEPLAEMAATSVGPLGEVDNFRRGWGGDTANFVLAAARLGGECGYVTRVGRDAFGAAFITMLETHGVDASHVEADAERHTGLYFVTYSEERKHRFDYVRRGSAASHLTGADIDPDYVAGARVLHASGISQAISRSCADAVRVAMGTAQEADTTVSYDANVRPALGDRDTLRHNFEAAVTLADIVFVSEEDSAYLYGGTSLEAVLDRIVGERPRLAVAKLGADGCLIKSEAGEYCRIPAWRVDAVDATGAGDAFSAGFVLSLVRGAELTEAGRYANAVGALTASGVGAIAPQPSHAEVMTLMRNAG
ncbi:MAG: sugar kinase [Rhodospirillales bacterium]|nr:sugar kinase [Rhodospirillales bacterium]